MGAGILPFSIKNNKLYFLFGKENRFADTPGWSDFGGGQDNNERPLQTALREAVEETTGFLGNKKDIKKIITQYGIRTIKWNNYTMFLCYIPYDENLVKYYNNCQKFIQNNLNPKIIKKSKYFEKSEIRWFSVSDLKNKYLFRPYFRNIVYLLQKNLNVLFNPK
uniref:Nudix hydrolase domain-containing protein n=1 Tax=viral metagenome TaxID=1070528 RepID=A0A6C0H4Q2_9ZZZZ